MNAYFKYLVLTFLFFSYLSFSIASGNLDSLVNHAIQISTQKLINSVAEINDSTKFPAYATKELVWKLRSSEDWTSGFYPGCLWYALKLSNDPKFEVWAKKWNASIEKEKYNMDTHDLGFRFMCTFEKGLKFANNINYNDYKETILTAANSLSKRYNDKIGCFSSNWDRNPAENSFPVVIDIMANLNIMFWAAKNGGSEEYKEFAINHALKTYKDFLRADGGSYHIVRYDKDSGEIINKGTLQGAGDETTWSRGHAWLVYGMIETYGYTKDKRFLEMAIKVSDYFIENLPDDQIPAWDFNSDIEYKDVSAGSIVCSALFELTDLVEDKNLKEKYRTQAELMLTALCKSPYFIDDLNSNCILEHSVQYLPLNQNVDVPAIFADYYFLEALYRYKK